MRAAILGALLLAGCEELTPASMGPGCHYVSCGDMVDGIDGHRCNIGVDGRVIHNTANGAEALDFIRSNNLRTCEAPK